jgi:hypothetical protein
MSSAHPLIDHTVESREPALAELDSAIGEVAAVAAKQTRDRRQAAARPGPLPRNWAQSILVAVLCALLLGLTGWNVYRFDLLGLSHPRMTAERQRLLERSLRFEVLAIQSYRVRHRTLPPDLLFLGHGSSASGFDYEQLGSDEFRLSLQEGGWSATFDSRHDTLESVTGARGSR